MAEWAQAWSEADLTSRLSRITAPTLVLTGEETLDRVVPVTSTRAYASLIRGAEYVVFRGTGHIGLMTQPARFAEIVSGFVHAHHQ